MPKQTHSRPFPLFGAPGDYRPFILDDGCLYAHRDWLLETTSHRSRDPFDRAIDLRITRIRRKIELSPDKPTVIRTVRGIGYMFVPPAE